MYKFDDLESKFLNMNNIGMHEDPNYSIRLSRYKKRLEDRENGVPVIEEEDRIRIEENKLRFGMPGEM